MAYETISDPSNPFNKTGLSLEARALLRYVEDARKDMAADLVATCTTDHALNTSAGHRSRHRTLGTDGEGLAIDGRMRTRGTAKNLHLPWFNAFAKVETQLHELIYAYAPYNIKAGKRVAPYAVSSHKGHVHVAVSKGVFLQYPKPSTPVVEPPAPISRTLAVHVHHQEQAMTHDHLEPLDQHGNAQWFTKIPWTKFMSVEACHPVQPYKHGYKPGVAAQPVEDDGKICIVITGGDPGGQARVMLTVGS